MTTPYVPTDWQPGTDGVLADSPSKGMVISPVRLNKIEQGVAGLDVRQSATTVTLGNKADTSAVPGLAPVQAVAGLTGSPTAAQVKTALALASSDVSDFTEAAQDAVAALLAAGTGVTLSYNDAGNTLTVTSAGSGGVTDPEVVRDTIGTALVGVGAITVAVNDTADTITISTAATVNRSDATTDTLLAAKQKAIPVFANNAAVTAAITAGTLLNGDLYLVEG